MGFISNTLIPALMGTVIICPVCGNICIWKENTSTYICGECDTKIEIPLDSFYQHLVKK